MSLSTSTAMALGSTAYVPAEYTVDGSYRVCQHQRYSMGGEARVEIVMVDFIGRINGELVAHSVLHLTSFTSLTNPCNTGTDMQGHVLFEEVPLSGTGVFVV